MATPKTILVTGSSGMIGTRLCETLMAQGFRVVGADIRRNKWNASVDKATVLVDLRDQKAVLKKLPKGVDCIVHLAANARVHDLVKDPSRAKDNQDMTFSVLEFARKNGVKKILFSSSREVYGNAGQTQYREDEANFSNCASPYTASKIADEAMVWAYQRCYGIDAVIFRFSNVYGMYDESDRAIPLFMRQAAKNETITIFGKDKLLDFTYIDDTLAGVVSAIKKFDLAKGRVYNIADGKGNSLLEVAQRIVRLLGSSSQIVCKDNRVGEVVKYVADITRAKKVLGYKPKTLLKDGVTKTIAWYAEHGMVPVAKSRGRISSSAKRKAAAKAKARARTKIAA